MLNYILWSLFSVTLAAVLAYRGRRKQSLSDSGAQAAFVVGSAHMGAGFQFGFTLIVFYLTSSKLTKLRQHQKAKFEAHFKEGGQRNAAQVLSNSLGACILAWLAAAPDWWLDPCSKQLASAAFLGHYACCCADTWASEVGILSRSSPRLITTGRRVPPGTNGGVSLLGLACSLAGGIFIGFVYAAASAAAAYSSGADSTLQRSWISAVLLAGMAGLFGSVVDSVLGATLQFSGVDEQTNKVVGRPGSRVNHVCGRDWLSNDAVNMLSAAVTSLMCAWLAQKPGVLGGPRSCWSPSL